MQILYEDADVLAVAKPPGIAVIPGREETPEQSLQGQLGSLRRERLWVVHRLDRDTSGVVLFARNEQAHRRLSMAFEHRLVKKSYLAWTRGVPKPEFGVITAALHPARKNKMRPAHPGEAGALESETEYRVLSVTPTSLGTVALVEANPKTGRQHQIRVHMRSVEAPLLVDPFYGRCERVDQGALGAGAPEVPRLTLHASRLCFPDSSGGTITVECPLAPDLSALDAWLNAQQGG